MVLQNAEAALLPRSSMALTPCPGPGIWPVVNRPSLGQDCRWSNLFLSANGNPWPIHPPLNACPSPGITRCYCLRVTRNAKSEQRRAACHLQIRPRQKHKSRLLVGVLAMHICTANNKGAGGYKGATLKPNKATKPTSIPLQKNHLPTGNLLKFEIILQDQTRNCLGGTIRLPHQNLKWRIRPLNM